eukprot:TRINITY_DN51475_c0_g1_i1.p1 TRINITY_DN51475_c0_g1~~TRINITY_DN51475_c0_g1_i1.p1  ORF type:complete len:268 (+),score=33.71 TRINITY_DN51475_c0_g1_i1:32-805(+)
MADVYTNRTETDDACCSNPLRLTDLAFWGSGQDENDYKQRIDEMLVGNTDASLTHFDVCSSLQSIFRDHFFRGEVLFALCDATECGITAKPCIYLYIHGAIRLPVSQKVIPILAVSWSNSERVDEMVQSRDLDIDKAEACLKRLSKMRWGDSLPSKMTQLTGTREEVDVWTKMLWANQGLFKNATHPHCHLGLTSNWAASLLLPVGCIPEADMACVFGLSSGGDCEIAEPVPSSTVERDPTPEVDKAVNGLDLSELD